MELLGCIVKLLSRKKTVWIHSLTSSVIVREREREEEMERECVRAKEKGECCFGNFKT